MDHRDRHSIDLDLENDDEEIRRLAVERLGGLPLDEALPRLLNGLGDPGWRVRKAVVERLAAAPRGGGVDESLVSALSDGENPGRRNSAVEALVRRGESAVLPLLAATRSDDVDVRKLVVDTLAGIGTPLALDRLLEMLEDEDPNVRAAAADAVGVIGDASVAPALLTVATRAGDDPLVAFSALQALARLEVAVPAAELAPALDVPLLRPAGYAVLGHADEGDEIAVQALLKGLTTASRSGREAAIEALLRLVAGSTDGGEALAERIRTATDGLDLSDAAARLAHADLSTRLVLIQFFGMLRRRELAIPILGAGTDEALTEVALESLAQMGELAEGAFDAGWPDLTVEQRALACRVLGRTHGSGGEARLLAALDDPDAAVRAAAAASLGERGAASAGAALVNRLEVVAGQEELEAEDELTSLTRALIQLSNASDASVHTRIVELLGQRLEGAPEPVRLALAAVLGRIGRAEDERMVAWLLKDPSAGVRRAAVQALARLGDGEARESLRLALADEAAPVRMAAARALAHSVSERALDDLAGLADDEDPRVRAAAMGAIGEYAGARGADVAPQALEILARALGDEGNVALAAVEALRALGTPEAARAARCLFSRSEPELVQAAVACIGSHGDRDSVEELTPLVAHSNWVVRAEVIQTLAERGSVASVPAILRRLETEQDDFVRESILRALRKLEG
jgi:HEAT repeat protein